MASPKFLTSEELAALHSEAHRLILPDEWRKLVEAEWGPIEEPIKSPDTPPSSLDIWESTSMCDIAPSDPPTLGTISPPQRVQLVDFHEMTLMKSVASSIIRSIILSNSEWLYALGNPKEIVCCIDVEFVVSLSSETSYRLIIDGIETEEPPTGNYLLFFNLLKTKMTDAFEGKIFEVRII